jgi:signal transduction histidine kinase
VTVAPLKAGEQPLFISITRDMTASYQAAEERERLIVELDAFAHTVAHDLKNPLNYMMASGEMLENVLREMGDEDTQHLVKLILSGGRKMTSIINALLLLSSVRKQDEVPRETLEMGRIVEGACSRVQQLVERYAAEIIVPDTWPAAIGHAQWVEEIWDNFLSNAIKYGGQPPRVELGADKPVNGRVRFWVKDNGEGIPPDKQAHLFIPFTRLDQASTKGHGLGLSIERRIVEKLNGQVGVESSLGQGSCFYFTLPAAPINSPKAGAGLAPVPTEKDLQTEIVSL